MQDDNSSSNKIVDWNIIKRLIQFIGPYRGRFILLVFLTTLFAALIPLRPYLIQLTIDNEVAEGDFQGLLYMIYLIIGLLGIQAIVQYSHTYLSGWIGQYIVKDIRIKLYDHLLKLRLKFYDKVGWHFVLFHLSLYLADSFQK